MSYSNSVAVITKKYVINLLNSLIFSNTLCWDGEDQYNYLPILHTDEDEKLEQRAALLVHKKYPLALRLIVSVLNEEDGKKVCYRLKSITDDIYVDAMNKTVRPFDTLNLDFAISDLNLAVRDDSALSFHDFYGRSTGRIFSLLKFLLDSDLIVFRDPKVFADIILADGTTPPVSSDMHFDPVFEVN
jgi:hypothetical protein